MHNVKRHAVQAKMSQYSRLIAYKFHMIFFTIAFAVFFSTSLMAKSEPWPQYSNIAPLPGSGIAIDQSGNPDGEGAFQINIPVAYTPGWGYVSLGGYRGDYTNEEDQDFGNGSGILAMGFGSSRSIKLYGSGMQVSRHWDEAKAVSLQVQLRSEDSKQPAIAFGVQDLLEKEKGMRSFYGVITKSNKIKDRNIFTTIGFGNGRFLKRFFGGVSVPAGDSLNLSLEWDGFQINSGLGWRPGGKSGKLTFLVGYNGKADWLAGASLATNFASSK